MIWLSGMIIGAAFGKIVTSLVGDIITPEILTPALERANLKDLNLLVIPGTAIKYGHFLSQVIFFLLVAVLLFLFIRAFNSMKRKEEAKPTPLPVPTKEEVLLAEVRDLLKTK